ncbi:hypothetical protein ACSBR2_024115 [Camellia fascicularis]
MDSTFVNALKSGRTWLVSRSSDHVFESKGDLYAHVEPFYYTSKFKAYYAESVYAIPTVEKPLVAMDDLVVLPPICKKPPGRLRKNRIPFRSEKIRRVQCGKCEKYGHNRKTYKETLP